MVRSSNKKLLKDNEVVVLGLLDESPRYGYELDKIIDGRGIREWTNIAFSSIYSVLRGLEKRDLLSSGSYVYNNRFVKEYRITRKGKELLKDTVASLLSEPRERKSELDLGIANILALSAEESKACLKSRQKKISARIRYIEKARKKKAKSAPYYVQALFERPISKHKAELEFVKDLEKKVEKSIEIERKTRQKDTRDEID